MKTPDLLDLFVDLAFQDLGDVQPEPDFDDTETKNDESEDCRRIHALFD